MTLRIDMKQKCTYTEFNDTGHKPMEKYLKARHAIIVNECWPKTACYNRQSHFKLSRSKRENLLNTTISMTTEHKWNDTGQDQRPSIQHSEETQVWSSSDFTLLTYAHQGRQVARPLSHHLISPIPNSLHRWVVCGASKTETSKNLSAKPLNWTLSLCVDKKEVTCILVFCFSYSFIFLAFSVFWWTIYSKMASFSKM